MRGNMYIHRNKHNAYIERPRVLGEQVEPQAPSRLPRSKKGSIMEDLNKKKKLKQNLVS